MANKRTARTSVDELRVAKPQLDRDVDSERDSQAASEAEFALEKFFKYAPDAMVMLDVDAGHFIEANDKAQRLFGLDREELLRVGPVDLSPPCQPCGRPSLDLARERIDAILEGGDLVFEWVHRKAHDDDMLCEVHLVTLPWAGRNVVCGTITDITEQTRRRHLQEGSEAVLQRVAMGTSLDEILRLLTHTVEKATPGMRCSVLLLDKNTKSLRHGAAPSLPDFYNKAVDGLKIGQGVGCCGTAAYTRQRVVVEDVLTHPYWAPYVDLAQQAGVRACWSEPIISSKEEVLGTFAMYYDQPRLPSDTELDAIKSAAYLAGIAIEHRQSEEALEDAHAELQRLIASVSDYVWSATIDCDGQFHYRYYSPVVEKITGRSPEFFMEGPHRWLSTVHAEDRPRLEDALARIGSGESTHETAEYRTMLPDSGFRWVRDSIVVHQLGSGEMRLDGVVSDITKQKLAEQRLLETTSTLKDRVWNRTEELARANDALRRSNIDLQNFADAASHDLREPLRAIASFCDLLGQRYGGQLDDVADEYLRHVSDGVTRMQKLLDGLLAFARVEMHGQPFRTTRCSEVVDVAVDNLRASIAINRATIMRDALPVVLADRGQLVELFEHLIGNAILYHGEQSPSVRVSAEKNGAMWQFCVRDNGIGVDPRYREQIFDIFERLHTREHYPGTGLGLALCHRIVDRHGGRIWVESQPSEGSSFFFTLPASR